MAHHHHHHHHGPPLLLTKRLTAFLHANISSSPHIHTALLATPHGKLLAHASASAQHTQPVRTLRTQTTVAASLWAMHDADAFAETVLDALPDGAQQQQLAGQTREQEHGHGQGPGRGRGHLPHQQQHASAVTVQLASGAVFVIRRLRCGLLFVCVGPGGDLVPAEGVAAHKQLATKDQSPGVASPDQSAGSPGGNGSKNGGEPIPVTGQLASPSIGSPSEAESVLSSGTGAATAAGASSVAGVAAIRRHAEEIARCLDERLGALSVPEEGIGGDGR